MRKTVVVLLTSLLLGFLPAQAGHVEDPTTGGDDLEQVVHDCTGDHLPVDAGNDLAALWVGTGYRDFDHDEDEVVDETLKLVLVAVVLGERDPVSADGVAARLLVRMETNNNVLSTLLEAVPDPEPEPPTNEDWRHGDGVVVVTGEQTNLVPLTIAARDVGFATTPTGTPAGDAPADPRTYRVVELGYRFADVFAPGAATAQAPFTIDADEWHVESFVADGASFASADVMPGTDDDCDDYQNDSATVVPDDPVVTGVTATPDENVDRRPGTKVRFHALMDLGGGAGDRQGYTYQWTFTNGDDPADTVTSTAAEPEVHFTEKAPVHVTVRVTDDLGRPSNLYDSKQDAAVPAEGLVEFTNLDPVADFRILGGEVPVAGDAVTFEDLSFDEEGDDVTAWSWDFNDLSAPATEQEPTHTFASPGAYDVNLTVTDEHGGTDFHVLRVFVCEQAGATGCKPPNAGPQAAFEASAGQVVQGTEVTFTDASTDRDGTIKAWSWDFGDGTTSKERNPKHTFTRVGTFSVTLTVTDDGGLQGTRALPVRVTLPEPEEDDEDPDLLPAPLAGFTLDPGEPVVGEPVRFRDNTTAQSRVVAWTWFFGDGSDPGDGADVTHTYAESGTYKVRLTVTDERGVRDTASKTVVVGSGQTDEDAPGLPVALLLAVIALAVAVRRRG